MKATIQERGNGFPDVGDYVPGDDGELYRVTDLCGGRIETSPAAGMANTMAVEVESADWTDCDEGSEFPALAVL